MLKRMKKLSAMLLAATITLGAFGATTASASPNYVDTEFAFTLTSASVTTPRRVKTDTSKVYMKCNYISASNKSYLAHAVGGHTMSDTLMNCSYGNYYTFYAGTAQYMTNSVKEDGYTVAAISAKANHSGTYTATGVWSPDNISGY